MNNLLDSIVRANETLWIPVAYDYDRESDAIQPGKLYFGTPSTDRDAAWADARRLCDEMDGVCFAVRRASLTAARG